MNCHPERSEGSMHFAGEGKTQNGMPHFSRLLREVGIPKSGNPRKHRTERHRPTVVTQALSDLSGSPLRSLRLNSFCPCAGSYSLPVPLRSEAAAISHALPSRSGGGLEKATPTFLHFLCTPCGQSDSPHDPLVSSFAARTRKRPRSAAK